MSAVIWSKFFWGDWRSDPALRSCSLAARGLWIDMLSLMAEADGYLLINDRSPSNAQLARVLGASIEEVETGLQELEDAGVFSRDRRSVAYCRRMVKDGQKAAVAREHGSNGGNPKLTHAYNKPGFLYLVGRRSDGAYKVGISVNPTNRLKKIRAQYPGQNLTVMGAWPVEDMGTSEVQVRDHFGVKGGVKIQGEWYFFDAATLGKFKAFCETLKGPEDETHKGLPGISQELEAKSYEDSSAPPERTQPQQNDAGAPFGKASRLPADWRPDQAARQYAKALEFDDRAIDRMAEDFRDFWRAKPGKDGVKLDWPATWRRWCRTERDRRAPKPRHPPPRKDLDWI